MKERIEPHIRWMIRQDMLEVLWIEGKSFDHPWTEDEFVSFLRFRENIGMVAEYHNEVVGYMMYELLRRELHLVNLAVSPDFLRSGVGSALISKLVGKLTPKRRNYIITHISETNLRAQLFFREQGFKATAVHSRAAFGRDEYQMEYHLCGSFEPKNRIAHFLRHGG